LPAVIASSEGAVRVWIVRIDPTDLNSYRLALLCRIADGDQCVEELRQIGRRRALAPSDCERVFDRAGQVGRTGVLGLVSWHESIVRARRSAGTNDVGDDLTMNPMEPIKAAEDVVGRLLAIPDPDRRFEELAQVVRADPAEAAALGSRLLAESDVRRRELGADLLGQATSVDSDLGEPAVQLLFPQLEVEQDPGTIASIITALGHVGDPAAIAAVMARANHVNEDVRFAVAYTLPILGLTSDSLATMRELTQDPDSDVRDWATFGLAQSDADDAATRQALFARIDDPDDDTRAEAMYGLAKRGDERVQDPLRLELEREDVGSLFVEAAALIGKTLPAGE
jgi:HEAT repeat protein